MKFRSIHLKSGAKLNAFDKRKIIAMLNAGETFHKHYGLKDVMYSIQTKTQEAPNSWRVEVKHGNMQAQKISVISVLL